MLQEEPSFYSSDQVVREYSEASGWRDPGEEVLFQAIAPLVRNKRILDLGVGGGRTIPILKLLSDRYIGIDYSASMVAVSKKRYPETDVRLGDATDLSDFDDDSFDFVFFSFNGIDTMSEQDRVKVYQAVHRVLEVDGLFAFSTLNKNGRSYAETPFQLHRPGQPWNRSAKAGARLLWRNCRDPLRLLRRYRTWWSTRSEALDANGWATCRLAAFDFMLVNHFVTLPRLREELGLAGFEVLAVYGSDKNYGPLPRDATTSTDDSFYALAKRRSQDDTSPGVVPSSGR